IAHLLENFPPQSSQQRAALEKFARETPLVYGQWKYFKKLWKLTEEPALNGGETEVALLAVMIARIECVSLSSERAPSWKQVVAPDAEATSAKTVKDAGAEYSVGGRGTSWDSSGWRLQVRRSAAPKSGGLL